MTSAAPSTRLAILFVDDDPLMLRALARALRDERERWEMMFVLGGIDALAALGTRRFSIVLTDLEMPYVDGRAVIASAKRAYPDVACVIHTAADVDEPTIEGCLILPKPASPSAIRSLLETLAQQHASER